MSPRLTLFTQQSKEYELTKKTLRHSRQE